MFYDSNFKKFDAQYPDWAYVSDSQALLLYG